MAMNSGMPDPFISAVEKFQDEGLFRDDGTTYLVGENADEWMFMEGRPQEQTLWR